MKHYSDVSHRVSSYHASLAAENIIRFHIVGAASHLVNSASLAFAVELLHRSFYSFLQPSMLNLAAFGRVAKSKKACLALT